MFIRRGHLKDTSIYIMVILIFSKKKISWVLDTPGTFNRSVTKLPKIDLKNLQPKGCKIVYSPTDQKQIIFESGPKS